MSPTITATRALTDLVDTARALTARARSKRRDTIADRLTGIALQLDAARTRLVQDGDEYLDTAWAMIDTARRYISTYQTAIGR